MKTKAGGETPAGALLQRILDRAAEVGADSVELEREPEGLEIMYVAGSTGVGELLEDRKLEGQLYALIDRLAGMSHKVKGRFSGSVQGRNRTISVEQYDSFGEVCFRLRLGPAS